MKIKVHIVYIEIKLTTLKFFFSLPLMRKIRNENMENDVESVSQCSLSPTLTLGFLTLLRNVVKRTKIQFQIKILAYYTKLVQKNGSKKVSRNKLFLSFENQLCKTSVI